MGWFEAAVLGVVEGLTEFLPVSSTGHLIVVQRLLGLPEGETSNAFAVGIQIGAITAILVLYWRRLLAALRGIAHPVAGQPNLLWQIAIAAVPAVVVGLLFEDWIDAHLFSPAVVAATLVVGGVLLIALERHLRRRADAEVVGELAAMPYRTALFIGLWQCLALVPGTSRSGATIAGALLLGLSRTAAAEFSFLVGLPILYGASLYKLLKVRDELTGEMVGPFVIGTVVSFVAALVVVKPFVAFVRRHDFVPFAWYRIVVGALLAALVAVGYLA
ncbi:MAG: undecaprenyl-diphosphate phosphatase [Planctomycetes bacterium]|nr:undecaprenyl-diphosphate phosphatase [Planctomycetota bacterium]